jgi:hypothetical protein
VFATSNLRRAAMTLLIAFEAQLNNGKIKEVYSLSDLQEISAGKDAKTLAKVGNRPALVPNAANNAQCPFAENYLTNLFKSECNIGDQTHDGEERIKRFCNWMNHLHYEDRKKKFVVVGHSAWLQDFFVRYLGGEPSVLRPTMAAWPVRYKRIFNPSGINEQEELLLDVSGKKKLSNAGVLYAKIKLKGNTCEIMVGKTEILSGEVKKSGTE